jgi:hypothetical protein
MAWLYWTGNALTAEGLEGLSARLRAGHIGSQSDTIRAVFKSGPISKLNAGRQNNVAELTGIENPLPGIAAQQERFRQSDQPLAAGATHCFRRFEEISHIGRTGRPEMATLSHFSASLPYGVLSGSFPTKDAVSMAITEV